MHVAFLYLSANHNTKKPKYLASKWSRRVQSAFVQTAWFVGVGGKYPVRKILSNLLRIRRYTALTALGKV
jgi:hypothetical protein